jgi:hypothetical protein
MLWEILRHASGRQRNSTDSADGMSQETRSTYGKSTCCDGLITLAGEAVPGGCAAGPVARTPRRDRQRQRGVSTSVHAASHKALRRTAGTVI